MVNRYDFGGLMFSLTHEYARLMRQVSVRAGLYTGQPRVLTMIKDNDGCTLKELSELCDIGTPSLSVSVRNMEKSGLLRRERGTDGRNQKIFLTESGREKAVAFHLEIDRFYKEMLERLGEDDNFFVDCVTKVRDYIREYCGADGSVE